MKKIIDLIIQIIDDCKTILDNSFYETPNIGIIKVVLREFEEIYNYYTKSNKILLLDQRLTFYSIKMIIDSVDYNYDQKLFDKVREASRLCKNLDKKIVEYRY